MVKRTGSALLVSALLCFTWLSARSAYAAESYQDIQETSAFTKVPADYNVEDKSKTIVVPNMPRIRSQGSFDTCTGCVSATIAQKYICDRHPDYVGLDCAKLPSKMEVSQLYMLSLNHTNIKGQVLGLPANHTNLKLREKDGESTAAVKSLLNASKLFRPIAESCFQFDRLVDKYANFSPDVVLSMLDAIDGYYTKYRARGAEECIGCADRINSALLTNIDAAVLDYALKQESFAQFLYSVVFSKKCDLIRMNKGPFINIFPKVNSPHKEKFLLLENLVSALGTNDSSHPVALSDICVYTYEEASGRKCLGHAVVISGHKVLCKGSTSDCRVALKVHNCWGMEWQRKSTNDGWVDGAKLLDNVSRERDEIVDGALTWYY